MKEELINSIVSMLQSIGIETDGIADRLYVLMKDIEIKPLETTLAVRDTVQNDRLIKRFLAAKMVKGCTPRTISMYGKSLHAIFSKFGKTCTDLTSDDIRLYIAFRITQDGIKKNDGEQRTAIPADVLRLDVFRRNHSKKPDAEN